MTPLQQKEIDKLKSIFGDEAVCFAQDSKDYRKVAIGLHDSDADARIGCIAGSYGQATGAPFEDKNVVGNIPMSKCLCLSIKERPERYPSLSIKLAEHEAKEKI